MSQTFSGQPPQPGPAAGPAAAPAAQSAAAEVTANGRECFSARPNNGNSLPPDQPDNGEASPPDQPGGGIFGPYGGSVTEDSQQPEGRKLFFWFFLVMLGFSLYLLYVMMQPFAHSIIMACVFTAISYPFYQRCLALTGNRRVPAAFIILAIITLILAVLIAVFVAGLVPQAKSSIDAVNKWLGGKHLGDALNNHIEPLLLWMQEHFPELNFSISEIRDNLTTLSTRVGQYLISSASSFLGNTVMFFAHLMLTLLIMFFLFIDGQKLLSRASYLFPLKPEQTAVIMESLRKMARAVLVGGFSVALIQGIVGGIGLYFVGIPALFWGTVMVFAALVPVVGTGLVWGPAVVFLLIMGQWKSALFLALWCGILVTSIDSILRPILLRGGAKLPLIFLFMSILGGVNVFGIFGLLYGPMILGLVAVMLNIYAEEYHNILSTRSKKPEDEAEPGQEP